MPWLQIGVGLAILVAGGVAYAIGLHMLSLIQKGGTDAVRADEALKQVDITQKQDAIIAEDRSAEDVAKRLDGGTF